MSDGSGRGFLWIAILFQALLIACNPDTHTGATAGITVYEHPDFQGSSHTFAFDVADFDDVSGPCGEYTNSFGTTIPGDWDNCISALTVTPDWEAVIYEHDDYEGDTLTVTSDIRDLDDIRGPCGNDWDDCISSIRVFRR